MEAIRSTGGAVYGSGSPSANATTATDRPPNVSKSDQQLYGDYAPVVRQLGVAADAAQAAHRELLDMPVLTSDQEPAHQQLLMRLHGLRVQAQLAHREAALHALRIPQTPVDEHNRVLAQQSEGPSMPPPPLAVE